MRRCDTRKTEFSENKKAELVEVIRTESVEGNGTEKEPVRTVTRYWEKDGRLIGERDK